jgi:hypothetical protein
VQIRVGEDGEWINCTAEDGAYNSKSEEYSCYLRDSQIPAGSEVVYIRGYNEFGVYIPDEEYAVYDIRGLLADTGDNYDLIVTAFVLINGSFLLLIKKMRNFSCVLQSNSLNWI